MTAAVPLVERLAEVLRAVPIGPFGPNALAIINEGGTTILNSSERADLARALLPVVEQAVAEARREALREAAAEGPATTPTDQLWRMWLRDRADAIATTEGAPCTCRGMDEKPGCNHGGAP